MRLANRVKFQCGEMEPLGAIYTVMDVRTSVFSSVITNYCPWCRSTFLTTLIARKHAAASTLSGNCRVDAGAFPWPISPPKSVQCSLCDDETVYTSIDELYDHSVAVHLPKPSPVSLPIDATSARGNKRRLLEDALMVDDAKKRRLTRRKSGGGGRGSATPSKETEAGARGDAISPRGLEKEAHRLLQTHHTADGHHHQAVSEDRKGNEVTVRSHLRDDHHCNEARRGEEQERTDASVQRGSPGSRQGPHTGSTSDLGKGRTDRRSPEAGGSGWSGQRSDTYRLLETARRHEHGHEVRSCEVLQGRSDVPIRASSHHFGGRQVRCTRPSRERAATVGSSTQVRQSLNCLEKSNSGWTHPTRQVGSDEGMLRAVSVITPRSPKWLSMVRSETVQR